MITENSNSWRFPGYEIDQPINWEDLLSRYDWLKDMKDVPQDSIWHAEGDVFTHTKMVVEALISLNEFKGLCDQDKHILVASAFMHDIEKRSCTTTERIDGVERVVSPRHAKKGEFTARKLLYVDFPAPFKIREQVAKLVRWHGLPLWAISKEDPAKAVIGASLLLNTAHLSMLAKADVLGRICDDQEEILIRIALFDELCKENNCFGKARNFASTFSRYWYFNKPDASPDFVPFDDSKFKVIVMSALPGTGKDTYVQKNLDLPVLSLDDIRRENGINPTDKKKNGWVIQEGKEQAKVYMRRHQSFIFNATNISKEMRSKWISLFTEYKAWVKIVYLEVPYKTLKKQNKNRNHMVPEKIIDQMLYKLEVPTFDEAHEINWIVRE